MSSGLAMPGAAAAAAEDWRDDQWYGWITIVSKGDFGGEETSPHGHDTTHRLRVTGSSARVIAASGSAYSLYESADCTRRDDRLLLGPGAPLPFGASSRSATLEVRPTTRCPSSMPPCASR